MMRRVAKFKMRRRLGSAQRGLRKMMRNIRKSF